MDVTVRNALDHYYDEPIPLVVTLDQTVLVLLERIAVALEALVPSPVQDNQ